MKKNLFFTAIFVATMLMFTNAQVGINTTEPNSAAVLDIVAPNSDKGILIPRISEADRDAKLGDNDPETAWPATGNNPDLKGGTLIFNTDANAFQYWDATNLIWRQLFVATSSEAGNDGVVKINSGAGGIKPVVTISGSGNTYGPAAQILFTTPLMFAAHPTTSWPETTPDYDNETVDKTPYIYIGSTPATQRFRENEVMGQVHIWRLIARITAGNNSSGSVVAIFRNPDSGFEVSSIALVPSGSAGLAKYVTFYFYTIADEQSITPGRGYQLFVQSDESVTLEVDSFTRVSLFKD